MLHTDARICLCPLVHMQTTQEDECAGMDSVSPMQYLRRNIRMSAGSDKASDLNSVSADSLLKYCLSLPTCKSDIWSQKDYVVVKDRARGVTDGVLRGDFGDGKKTTGHICGGTILLPASKAVSSQKKLPPSEARRSFEFTFSISNRGAVNLAAQKQLPESRGMRGRKRRRVGREERRRE